MASHRPDESFLTGANAPFIAELYAKFLADPGSVDTSWASFFAAMGDESRALLSEMHGATWSPRETAIIGNGASWGAMVSAAPAAHNDAPFPIAMPPAAGVEQVRRATLDSIRALMMIRNYRVRGHLHARLDPLGLAMRAPHPELDPANYGFGARDMDRPIFINYVLGLESASLREIIDICRKTYCGTIGVEFMHIQEPEQKAWIQERIEGIRNRTEFTDLGKRTILQRLTEAEVFERFLDKKYTGTKRFGLDGGESVVPAIEQILKRGSQLGLEEIVIGMAHRGRLNFLANVMRKPYRAIFSEFQGNAANPEDVQGSGDVKYHLGSSADRHFGSDVIHLSLTANPSHLEAVNTVVLGKVRAKQWLHGDSDRSRTMGLLLHGDAAFAGQGMAGETLALSQLKGYRTGGTIHFVINNQIGFTTNPAHSRSSPYCSDVGKMVAAPIFHVNGDDPEACVHVARIATEFRQKFKKDVVIDQWCYRRHGHNEADEPAFTQPIMYRKIAQHPAVRTIYAKMLEVEGLIEPGAGDAMVTSFQNELDEEFALATGYKPNKADWLDGRWSGMSLASGEERRGETAVEAGLLQQVGRAISEVPRDVNVHRKIVRQLAAKRRTVETGQGVDWATAEALALGTLLCEGTPVRMTGEDTSRGTFSQRHAVLIDQDGEDAYVPLNNIRNGQAALEIIDSPLSEFGVLGFEYGFSLAEPHALVLWEAQFGDFVNGAQVIIDQFICSGEAKWLRMCGLVMLLPHGYEGQGSEHSSARLERFLQLCAEDNIQVCNCTTPASYFHVLRRQIRRDFRKPLILMTPKSLLRHRLAVSKLGELETGTSFHRLLWDDARVNGALILAADKDIRRLILCTGKVYFDLYQERNQRQLADTYIMRLEQLYPFPRKALATELKRFPKAEIVWCQEEPENMGAWTFVSPRIESALRLAGWEPYRPTYAGRASSAAPATGLLKRHNLEQAALIDDALSP